ncbi:rRNA methyltransferase [Actinomadura madurae]|uniref:rRNA methyltransferase n=1 Tax=Actinomadura madurae TaxID=1993 RepID=UPI0020263E5D|nr:rRNA methyltransferase [Actinomadura madurae]MCP9947598.1 rRNA methyltransferase [Actinomadura madurae]MCP9964362.1 rRNA methyltransferase [Actinomadura madurae]MCP9976846.1 rRNA methyltransferase [Actinomadura madurae]MCQ0011663.1 rRNA methyltransferase [Actinomadura madurae]MCQ0013028.1 rRNA methyltransferase [Actinomadura madurae]
MAYRYAVVRENYEDLASGGVLHSAPGFPAFPVRLASEMFQRALAMRQDHAAMVWDPCCGSGYMLTVLGLLHPGQITAVVGTDIDPAALRLAGQNLALLDEAGLSARAADLDAQAERWDKPSYAAAAQAARRLARRLPSGQGPAPHLHQADVFDPRQLRQALDGRRPGLVVTDVPYGEQTGWRGPGGASGTPGMLRALGEVLSEDAVIAVAVRGRKLRLDDGPRADATFRIGTRTVGLFRVRPTTAP